MALDISPTFFHTIESSVYEYLKMWSKESIYIFSNVQLVLKALETCIFGLQLISKGLVNVKALTQQNPVVLIRTPGSCICESNYTAECLIKKRCAGRPFCCNIPKLITALFTCHSSLRCQFKNMDKVNSNNCRFWIQHSGMMECISSSGMEIDKDATYNKCAYSQLMSEL